MKFIHISDLHLIGDELPSLYGLDPDFRLQKALESIAKWHHDAKFVTITGDLSDSVSDKTYARLKNFIDNFDIDIYPILGNHDKRDLFELYFPEFICDGFAQYAKEIDTKVFIFLDTLVEDAPHGMLCHKRLIWLKTQLERYSNNQIYIFMHHHPVECGLYEMDNVANFKTADDFWHLLSAYDNIKHISFGHIHRIMHSCKNGVTLHSTRSTAFEVAYRPDSKKEYLTNEENPTYAVVQTDKAGEVRVHHHEYMNEDRIFTGFC